MVGKEYSALYVREATCEGRANNVVPYSYYLYKDKEQVLKQVWVPLSHILLEAHYRQTRTDFVQRPAELTYLSKMSERVPPRSDFVEPSEVERKGCQYPTPKQIHRAEVTLYVHTRKVKRGFPPRRKL